MRLLGRWWFTVRSVFRGRAADRDTEEELRFHLEQQTAAHVRAGAEPAAAQRETLRIFGGVRRIAEECRESSGAALFDSVRQDVRYAARGLARAPLFTAAVVLLLGLGIGLNAAMFGMVDHVILNGPAHVVDPDRLRRVYTATNGGDFGTHTGPSQPYAFYRLIRDQARTVSGAATYNGATLRVGDGLDSYTVPAMAVTASFFPLLGVHPEIGRFFTASEDDPRNPSNVVVLGDGMWRRSFGADRGVIGKSYMFGKRRLTVIGVAPPDFTGATRTPVDAWLPESSRHAGDATWYDTWNWSGLKILVRPAAHASIAAVDAELQALAMQGYGSAAHAMGNPVERVLPISYANDGEPPKELGVTKLLLAVALIVFLIAILNVSNLLVARALRRRREVAVRAALGAGSRRITRLFVTEGAMLALLAAGVAVAIAWWTAAAVRVWLFPNFDWSRAPVDPPLLGYLALASMLVAFALGMAPLRRLRRTDVAESLKSGAPQSGSDKSAARTWLQGAQVALTAVLLVSAAAFVASLVRVRDVDLGMEPDRVLAINLALPEPDSGQQATRFRDQDRMVREILARLEKLPGVDAAAAGMNNPFVGSAIYTITVPGRDSLPRAPGGGPYLAAITPDYFKTTGMRLLAGRPFRESDDATAGAVVIVNRTMAAMLWPGKTAVGRCFHVGDPKTAPCATVVGIVADARLSRVKDTPAMQYYLPVRQWPTYYPQFLVRARGNEPMALVPTLRSALRSVAPGARLLGFRPWTEALEPEVHAWRIGSRLFGAFGLLALVVACFGLYSLASYNVAQRTHELGVRIALGASARGVVGLVLRNGLSSVALGAVAGIAAALLLAPTLQPLLFNTSAHDPRLYAGVMAAILITSLAASLVPSWRATRVDPLTALRAD